MDWITHDEDVWFEFKGGDPHQLVPGRYYRGRVDGFADFGVFVDLSRSVTGLLHRSELDRRLESLDWDPGDEVFVQVKNVRENGDVDLAWSIRQSPGEFRGARVHNPGAEEDGTPIEDDGDHPGPVRQRPTTTGRRNVAAPSRENGATSDDGDGDDGDGAADADTDADAGADAAAADGSDEPSESPAEDDEPTADEAAAGGADAEGTSEAAEAATDGEAAEAAADGEETSEAAEAAADGEAAGATERPEAAGTTEDEDDGEGEGEAPERVEVGSLSDRVGETVRVEGEVVGARQTGGPTVFELRDETAVVDCAAFVEAGVRAYPEVDVGDVVRIDGEVELRRNELQVETEELVVLEGEEREAVGRRLADALTDRARPASVEPLADHGPVEAVADDLADAAEAVRRAVFESRPVVVRHAATADGYVAGAAVERAVLPLVREEHAQSDAEYHYFDRRPLDEPVYGMDAATKDVTRMLQDNDRHGEKFPLVLLVGTASTAESRDGLDLLGIYDAERVVVDAASADDEVAETVDVLVNPGRAGADAADLSTGALAATLAAAVNDEVRAELSHLPATSYWETPPEAYQRLAAEAGYDVERCRELREAVALEAYYQSYEDKRELVADLLFEGPDPEDGGLAGHVSRQFRRKLDDELETAEANLETREVAGVRAAVLDTEAFTHQFDFPPTTLLVDELHRRGREHGRGLTVAIGMDELYVRADGDLDVRAVAGAARERVPNGGVTAVGVRDGRVEFLNGARDAVRDAVIEAAAERL
jgi:RecJ-like exonuclease